MFIDKYRYRRLTADAAATMRKKQVVLTRGERNERMALFSVSFGAILRVLRALRG